LRQYILQPGRRDEFIALSDEHFIEEQERYGAHLIGQCRDRNHPRQFVWLRGFSDMRTRHAALEGFYHSSPIWQEHRSVANEMLVDVGNVLLLTPARPTTDFRFDPAQRLGRDEQELAGGVNLATVYAFAAPVAVQFIDFFEMEVAPRLGEAGATLLGHFVTEPSQKTYPALPVRESVNVFVWFASFANETAYRAYNVALTTSQEWSASLVPTLRMWGARPEEVLELIPTRRSFLRFREDRAGE
jgi:hypothetical protein